VIIWPTSEKVASVALPLFVGTIVAKENNPGIRGQNGENGVNYAKLFGVGIRNPKRRCSSADQC
jgi:hypothetical protein